MASSCEHLAGLTVMDFPSFLEVETIQGRAAGTPADSENTLRFAELNGVRPMIETYPLEEAGEGYARMMSGNAQFRVVLPSLARPTTSTAGSSSSPPS